MRFLSVLCLLPLWTLSAAAEPYRYQLDPAHTTVAFKVGHIGFADTLGVFTNVSGTFMYDMENQLLSDLKVEIRTSKVETFHKARNEHVRSSDFLDAMKYPVMTFQAASGKADTPTTGTVSGFLTLRGISQPLTLDVTLNRAANYPFGHGRFTLGISARALVKRSAFGMTYALEKALVGDEVEVIIETEAMRIN